MTKVLQIAGGLVFCAAAAAQPYVASIYAGGGAAPTAAIAVDGAENVYFGAAASVFKLDRNGVLTRVAGNSTSGYSGDGGQAINAQLTQTTGLAVDAAGNLFLADLGRVRRVSPGGIIATVAGNGTLGFSGDGGPATDAAISVGGISVDGAGNLFLADERAGRIRKVSPAGIITTIAGTGTFRYSGDGGPATSAQLSFPSDVAVDSRGNIYVADTNNCRVRRIDPNGIITTIAGSGVRGYSGDGGSATDAQLNSPTGVAVDGVGNVYFVDGSNLRVRRISPGGIITTVAGNGTQGSSGDGGLATGAQLNRPLGVAADTEGNLFITGSDFRVRKVSPDGIITTVADNGNPNSLGDGGPAAKAQLDDPEDVAVDGAGNLFIADAGNGRVRKVTPDGIITTVAGNGTLTFCANGSVCPPVGDGGPATSAQLSLPWGLAVDGAGNLFIADGGNNTVRKVSPNGTISTVASLSLPGRMALDGMGNLFIGTGDDRIRKVSPDGVITTVAGNGQAGFSGDGGPAQNASLSFIDQLGEDAQGGGMAVDGAGGLVVADTYNNRVRKISPDGLITTIAGGGSSGGDGGPATSAQLDQPWSVAFDGAGTLFISEETGERIRKVSPDETITTVADRATNGLGPGMPGYAANGAPYWTGLEGIAADGAGNVYFATAYLNTIRVLRLVTQSIKIGAVVDAASEQANPVSPGKIVVIYGTGLGPAQLIQNQPSNGQFGTAVGGTSVFFNGIAAPILYTSATQVAAVVPYAVGGTTAQVTVAYQGQASDAFTVPVALTAPSFFTYNQSGAGQAAAINAVDGTLNTAANPVKIGAYISLYATGEGQTNPAGVDGKLADSTSIHPVLPVTVTVGGIPAFVQYKGGAPGEVAGLMQINVQIPSGVQPGGYVPVVLQVGDASTVPDAVWIAVSGN